MEIIDTKGEILRTFEIQVISRPIELTDVTKSALHMQEKSMDERRPLLDKDTARF